MTCQSFFHTSDYEENEIALENDASWLIQHAGVENAAIAKEIVNVQGARRVYEAGCGVGSLLLALEACGAFAEGIDPNPNAVAMAVERGAKATTGYFSTLSEPVDAILAIDVLEHLKDPRKFFGELIASVVDGGCIIVRVPEVDESVWHYLRGADQARENIYPDPFVDNSVHINHFSEKGLRLMGESLSGTYGGRITGDCHLFRRV